MNYPLIFLMQILMNNSCLIRGKFVLIYKLYFSVNKKMEALTPSASELVGRVANFTVRNSRKI